MDLSTSPPFPPSLPPLFLLLPLPPLSNRLEEEEARHSTQSREQSELISQLRLEVTEVTAAFRSQLQSLQEEHQRVVAGLKEEVKLSHDAVSRLQQVGRRGEGREMDDLPTACPPSLLPGG